MAVDLLSEFSAERAGEARIWLRRPLAAKTFIDAVADPDRLFERAECQIVKDERKIKVGRVKLKIAGVPTGVYIKRYNAFSWVYRVTSLFRLSRAIRSLKGALILSQAGVGIASPIGAVECRRWAMLKKSFFLSEEIASGKTADSYWREKLKPLSGADGFKRRRKFLASLAMLFRQLHSRRIYHNDLKDANIVVKPSETGREHFYLLDLEGVRRCAYISRRRRVKNMVQLNRTLGRFLSNTEKLHLLRKYMSDDCGNKRDVRNWIARILPMTQRAERRSALSHLGAKEPNRAP
ncbi:MAG: lipopolysaccharide kinase InaA family protein [Candidatus Binatia bacterium]